MKISIKRKYCRRVAKHFVRIYFVCPIAAAVVEFHSMEKKRSSKWTEARYNVLGICFLNTLQRIITKPRASSAFVEILFLCRGAAELLASLIKAYEKEERGTNTYSRYEKI